MTGEGQGLGQANQGPQLPPTSTYAVVTIASAYDERTGGNVEKQVVAHEYTIESNGALTFLTFEVVPMVGPGWVKTKTFQADTWLDVTRVLSPSTQGLMVVR